MCADGLTDVIYRLKFSSVFLTPYQSSVIVYCLVDLILRKTEIFHRVTKVFHFAVLLFTFWFPNLYKNVVQAVSTSIRVCRLFLLRIHFVKKTLSCEAVSHSASQNNSVYQTTPILIAVSWCPAQFSNVSQKNPFHVPKPIYLISNLILAPIYF
jgi:hypothetical protein